MEDMMGLVALIIIAIAAAVAQKQNRKKTQSRRTVSMDAYASGAQKAREKAASDMKHRQEYRQKLEERRDELRAQKRQGEAPHEPHPMVAPTVDSQAGPTVQLRMHVTPHTEDMFAGSMNANTGEGDDPCHEDDLTPAVNPCELSPRAVQPAPATSGLNLTWTGDAMVKAVVMQEILTRPCQRARR